MKYQKKNLWFLVSAGLLSLAFVSGCDKTEESEKGKKKGAEKTETTDTYNNFKWGQLDGAAIGNAKGASLSAVSGNNSHLYLATEKGELFAGDAAKFTDAASWNKIGYNTPIKGFDGSVVGKASLVGAKKIISLRPTKDGVLAGASEEASLTNDNDKNGAFYVKGTDIVNIWNHTGGLTGTHVSTGLGGNLSAGKPMVGYVVANAAGEEFVYLATFGGNYSMTLGKLGTKDRIEKHLKTEGTRTGLSDPVLGQSEAGAPVYVVDQWGTHVLPADKIGQQTELANVDTNTPVFGSDAWKFKNSGVDNYYVKDVAVVGNKVYIGLGGKADSAAEAGQGGVAVFTADAKPAVVAPAAAWNKVSVKNFIVDGEKVMAVVANGIIEIDAATGAPVEAIKTNAGDSAKRVKGENIDENGELLPTANITSARMVDGNLVITTSDKGVIYRLKAVETKI